MPSRSTISGCSTTPARACRRTMPPPPPGTAKPPIRGTDAQFNLGLLYDNGQGAPQDHAAAAAWYRKAADQGDAEAQTNLGIAYATGQGVAQDYVLARMWLNLAAAQGDTSAGKARDVITTSMTPAEIAEAQRLASAWKPTRP
uniref:Sel1 repeat family protein n=1 Tax=Phenylobacterium glaciei TaxID=2803784 RepID=A0A974P3G7_9CAUL|nr:sel1 repeat family protein [Phenylobacterium glaciei]